MESSKSPNRDAAEVCFELENFLQASRKFACNEKSCRFVSREDIQKPSQFAASHFRVLRPGRCLTGVAPPRFLPRLRQTKGPTNRPLSLKSLTNFSRTSEITFRLSVTALLIRKPRGQRPALNGILVVDGLP